MLVIWVSWQAIAAKGADWSVYDVEEEFTDLVSRVAALGRPSLQNASRRIKGGDL